MEKSWNADYDEWAKVLNEEIESFSKLLDLFELDLSYRAQEVFATQLILYLQESFSHLDFYRAYGALCAAESFLALRPTREYHHSDFFYAFLLRTEIRFSSNRDLVAPLRSGHFFERVRHAVLAYFAPHQLLDGTDKILSIVYTALNLDRNCFMVDTKQAISKFGTLKMGGFSTSDLEGVSRALNEFAVGKSSETTKSDVTKSIKLFGKNKPSGKS